MQFIVARLQRNVVPKVATPQVPVNIGVQCSEDSLGRADEHMATCKETIRAPRVPAAIDEGSGGARDHPKTLDGRCRCATWVGDGRGLGLDRGRTQRPPTT